MNNIFFKSIKHCCFFLVIKILFGSTLVFSYQKNISTIEPNTYLMCSDTLYLNISVCDSIFWNGNWYMSSGSYIYSTLNSQGFDSATVMNLNIINSTNSTTNAVACGSYNWNGQTYFSTGTYSFSTTDINGCDSTAILNLTINQPSTLSLNVSACESFYWNDFNYTSSGTFFYITHNSQGCDSIVELNLTINKPTTSIIDTTVCDVFYWNGGVYESSGIYIYNTLNANGCDSIVTLNLTIRNSSNLTFETIKTCDSYMFNGKIYEEDGQYIDTLTNINGCDSVVVLNLLFLDEIHIPNTFTPNNDKINDVFPDIYFKLSEYSITIFNYWGQELFSSKNYNNNWDGKFNDVFCEEGVYFYVMNYKCNENKINKFGQVTILN